MKTGITGDPGFCDQLSNPGSPVIRTIEKKKITKRCQTKKLNGFFDTKNHEKSNAKCLKKPYFEIDNKKTEKMKFCFFGLMVHALTALFDRQFLAG